MTRFVGRLLGAVAAVPGIAIVVPTLLPHMTMVRGLSLDGELDMAK